MRPQGKRRPPAPRPLQRELGFIEMTWLGLTPMQRMRRSWRLRRLLKDPQAVHDAKLWPKP